METTKTPLHVALFLLKPKGNFVFELFQLKKKKEKPLNISISPLKDISHTKDNHTPTACLEGFYGKNNFIITLLQSMVICV
jgi:hypothetical protein